MGPVDYLTVDPFTGEDSQVFPYDEPFRQRTQINPGAGYFYRVGKFEIRIDKAPPFNE